MTLATQATIDDLTRLGRLVLDEVKAASAALHVGLAGHERDINLGRDLALAIFLAARGDDIVNRVALIEGFGQAVGECIAQQPPENAAIIEAALCQGLQQGAEWGREMFAQAGHA